MTRILWRIAGTETAGACDAAALQAGLRLHLQHSALTTVAVQIGTHQRVYVACSGCVGCQAAFPQPCVPGCHADLLRRMLGATWPGLTLERTQRGVLARPYTRTAAIRPTATAQPFTAAQLAAWRDARLVLHWPQQRTGVTVAGLLAVGADGPDLHDVLAAHGWTTRRVPRPLRQRWAGAPLPPVLPGAHAWPGAPLLVPPPHATPGTEAPTGTNAPPRAPIMTRPALPRVTGSAPAADTATTALAERVAATLAPLIVVDPDADATFVAQWSALPLGGTAPQITDADAWRPDLETVDDPDPSIWPHGPGTMRPAAVGALLEQLRTSPIITTGETPGVSRKRLALVLPDVQAEYARQLLVWLDQAGLLQPPLLPDDPFRAPRPLVALDDVALAERLAATPVPSSAAARAATQ